ncbi:hypothetical protein [uncultured Stenotrophomonas sp.]|uniref:hypothetical protein n=1 Tax=uncultured Stenotrophomonas sp. TaxID=165438 RepID=UPI0031F2DE83
MLLVHPIHMAQHDPRSSLHDIRRPGRARQALSVAPGFDLQTEYQFWQMYERVVRPLPGGGLRRAWLVCQKVYRDRWQFPDDSDAAALSRVLFGGNMTAGRASELAELHALVSRRVALLARRGRMDPAA